MRWQWDAATKRYRNPDTGRFLSESTVVGLRDEFIEAQKDVASGLAERLSAGDITIQRWESEMRQHMKTTYINEYTLGRGGRNAMNAANWGEVGGRLGNQYRHLHGFAADIAAGNMSEAQIKARSAMYVESATDAFERGKARAYGVPALPAYPGDGSTECGVNCHCRWEYDEDESEWRCTWALGAADHCDTCVTRASLWAPLVILKG